MSVLNPGGGIPASTHLTRQERRELQEKQRAVKAARSLSARATKLILVRHGETDWNAERRLQGQRDPPLNQLGVCQAQAVAARLANDKSVGRIYSSDLQRALQTASTIFRSLSQVTQNCGGAVIPLAALRERCLGRLEGLLASEAAGANPTAWQILCSGSHEDRLPGGESAADVELRATEGITMIAERHVGESVIVVTHGGVLQALYRQATGTEYGLKFHNCALNTLWVDQGKWKLGIWGEAGHLSEVGAHSDAFGGGNGG